MDSSHVCATAQGRPEIGKGAAFPAASSFSLSCSRNALFAGSFAIGLANGLVTRLVEAIARDGAAQALFNSFDISVIVWIGAALSLSFMQREMQRPATRADLIVAGACLMAFLVPLPPLSWVGLALLSAYAARTSQAGSFARRGAWIMLAVTVPMFWSRMLFSAFSDLILRCDAALVGWMIGTPRLGNAIAFADGTGFLWIAPGCSSLANMSLALLCWVMFAQYRDIRPSAGSLGWGALACAAVLAINVGRLSLIGLHRDQYELLHGPVGATVANWLTVGATLAICWLGVRHDRFARR